MNKCDQLILAGACLLLATASSRGEDNPAWFGEGKVSLNARLRFEDAHAGTLAPSQALTARVRLGYELGVGEQIRLFAEGEAVVQVNDEASANLAGQNDTEVPRTPIADPEATELNRLWAQWKSDDLVLKVGRQRVVFDNSRFVGNVGWRQNEQTFDAGRITLSPADVPWSLDYLYVDKVQRIFGDDAPGGADFDAEVHLLRASYAVDPALTVIGFAYLQQLTTASGSPFGGSNDTFGLRATGVIPMEDEWKFQYSATYALQEENGGSPMGADFDLDYLELTGKVTNGTLSAGIGWEQLAGDGARMFTTPLATVHAFNGWADVFLGASIGGGLGPGVSDTFLDLSAKLPVGNGIAVRGLYHWFSAENGGADYGEELDLVAAYSITKQLKATAKYARFESAGALFSDKTVFWLQLDFAY